MGKVMEIETARIRGGSLRHEAPDLHVAQIWSVLFAFGCVARRRVLIKTSEFSQLHGRHVSHVGRISNTVAQLHKIRNSTTPRFFMFAGTNGRFNGTVIPAGLQLQIYTI